jgi:hypothetical protein
VNNGSGEQDGQILGSRCIAMDHPLFEESRQIGGTVVLGIHASFLTHSGWPTEMLMNRSSTTGRGVNGCHISKFQILECD